jgi:SAM-dependent methyltransferase
MTIVSNAFTWSPISTRVSQFAYFDQLLGHPVWKGRKVLDFGGNVGGLLVGAGEQIDHSDYWCIDLNLAAIEEGRRRYPHAHFVHYDRYSSQYNPGGIRDLPIPHCGVSFDIILAFSVFTHAHKEEVTELVSDLRGMLAPEGVLAFTFCDARYDRSLTGPELSAGSDVRKILEKLKDKPSSRAIRQPGNIDEIVRQANDAKWCLLIDEQLYVEPGAELCNQRRTGTPDESYNSYFTVDYMASLFPQAMVLPPVSPEWQHCCIVKK